MPRYRLELDPNERGVVTACVALPGTLRDWRDRSTFHADAPVVLANQRAGDVSVRLTDALINDKTNWPTDGHFSPPNDVLAVEVEAVGPEGCYAVLKSLLFTVRDGTASFEIAGRGSRHEEYLEVSLSSEQATADRWKVIE